ncbi:hypothetical protein [Chloroflexus sp.]|uniref:hypothetical protein n=1 Tax=Chloroflexus sp. TaxID=1904827 RepID=UPI003C745F76
MGKKRCIADPFYVPSLMGVGRYYSLNCDQRQLLRRLRWSMPSHPTAEGERRLCHTLAFPFTAGLRQRIKIPPRTIGV